MTFEGASLPRESGSDDQRQIICGRGWVDRRNPEGFPLVYFFVPFILSQTQKKKTGYWAACGDLWFENGGPVHGEPPYCVTALAAVHLLSTWMCLGTILVGYEDRDSKAGGLR